MVISIRAVTKVAGRASKLISLVEVYATLKCFCFRFIRRNARLEPLPHQHGGLCSGTGFHREFTG